MHIFLCFRGPLLGVGTRGWTINRVYPFHMKEVFFDSLSIEPGELEPCLCSCDDEGCLNQEKVAESEVE